MTTAVGPIAEKKYSVEEYFELEKHSDIRHEFINGQLIAMSGESIIANRIAGNCGFYLEMVLRAKGYDIIRHDVRTVVEPGKKYRYPDVQVVNRKTITDTHAVTQPVLLIEVSSLESAKTDHETKLNEYIQLPSLQYYLIISQYEPLVQLYSRDDQGWRFEVFSQLEDKVSLPKLGCVLKVANIYENVEGI
ncbi:MAG: Uma2 family endonuclease [Saprospiraceae bacterium]